ncbi:solute carrier family 49 member 4 homolog [Nematostella vectensis]|uniref:solute carrier family 49 member 4 homolog n=1 Tax=Nematostella vectensis TaxID=45351 RepID=UPI0020773F6E|nr:solute carrier family 49 member 4 homolog [Nematostella vectensis]
MATEDSKETSALLDPTASISSLGPLEDEDSIPNKPEIKTYPQRWYMLIVFTLLNATTNLLWNTWPPIQETCQLVFGWTKTNVLIIGALQAGGSILSVIPSSWFIDTKGLRVAVVTSLSVQLVGVVLEILPVHPYWARTTLITFGEFLIAIAAPVVQNVGVLVLSASWFPPEERMTATAFATLVSYLGSASSYVMGPYMVPDVETGNITYTTGHKIDIDKLRNLTSPAQLKLMESKINEYILVECVLTGVLFFLVWIYFPEKPPTPPSISSSKPRLDFIPGAKTLMTNKHFLLLLAIFSISNGVNWGWSSVQDLIFSHVGISQKAAGWLGFFGNIASTIAIAFSWYADRIKRFTKRILMGLFVMTVCCQTVLTLACEQVFPLTTTIFYISGISAMVFYCGTVPLVMEMAAECTYPVAEGITSGVLILSVYTFNLFFFIGFMFPQASPLWMNWLLVSSSAICIPLIACFKGKYNRLDVDTKEN